MLSRVFILLGLYVISDVGLKQYIVLFTYRIYLWKINGFCGCLEENDLNEEAH